LSRDISNPEILPLRYPVPEHSNYVTMPTIVHTQMALLQKKQTQKN